MPWSKTAGRSASELRRSLETKVGVADPVDGRGRPVPAMLTRRTKAGGGFRGSRGGMWWKSGAVVLETRDGALGDEGNPTVYGLYQVPTTAGWTAKAHA